MALSKESYGLEWLGKSYARVLAFCPPETLLKEDEEWNRQGENKHAGHILIKGDNLEVLKHLVHAYCEAIKVIYIDPPYNTGNDGFVYKDNRKFSAEELSKMAGIDRKQAKRILDFIESQSQSHSAWLTFMYPRLYIARQLLREDGVLFVSIDDHEVAQLRLMLDEIFGEENFVETLKIQMRNPDRQLHQRAYFQKSIEYVLVYAKDHNKLQFKKKEIPYRFHEYRYKIVEKSRGERRIIGNKEVFVFKPGEYEIKSCTDIWDPAIVKSISIRGKIKTAQHSGKFYEKYLRPLLESDGRDTLYKVMNMGDDGMGFRYIKQPSDKTINGVYYQGIPQQYRQNIDLKRASMSRSWPDFFNFVEENIRAGAILKELFGEKIFDTVKPVNLIKWLIGIASSPHDLILDFFAGSGTTGDAVLQLNAEDGGQRRFILVQLDEPIDPKKHPTVYAFVRKELGEEKPTIFSITRERLVRAGRKIKKEVLEKIKEKEQELQEWQQHWPSKEAKKAIKELEEEIGRLKRQEVGFKVFETVPIWEGYLADEEQLTEQTDLFDASLLSDEDVKALLITWKTYDGIPLTEDYKEIQLNDYKAYYCQGHLYLLHKGWKTDNMRSLLEKLEREKDFVLWKVIVFGYHFTSWHIREIEENIKNHRHTKSIEIETILRV